MLALWRIVDGRLKMFNNGMLFGAVPLPIAVIVIVSALIGWGITRTWMGALFGLIGGVMLVGMMVFFTFFFFWRKD